MKPKYSIGTFVQAEGRRAVITGVFRDATQFYYQLDDDAEVGKFVTDAAVSESWKKTAPRYKRKKGFKSVVRAEIKSDAVGETNS